MTKTALLVIDIINSCCSLDYERNNTSYNKIRSMVNEVKEFIRKIRYKKIKIIFIKTTPWTKEFLPENIKNLYKDKSKRFYSDKNGSEFYLINPQASDIIFEKNTYDAFAHQELDKFLKNEKISDLIITGIFGDGCVNATINGAFSKGYNLIILKDLIETTDDRIRQDLLANLKDYTWPMMYGTILDSKKFIDDLK